MIVSVLFVLDKGHFYLYEFVLMARKAGLVAAGVYLDAWLSALVYIGMLAMSAWQQKREALPLRKARRGTSSTRPAHSFRPVTAL